MSVMRAPPEEFYTPGPRWLLWILYGHMLLLYVLGGATILLYGVFMVGVLWGKMSAPAAEWARHVPWLVGTIAMLLGARLCQKGISAIRDLSLKVDASSIHVTDMRIPDMRRNRYVVDLAEIDELKVSKSFWLGNRIRVVLVSGRQYHLGLRARALDTLIEKITTNAGLDSHFRDGRWDVYSRSHARM